MKHNNQQQQEVSTSDNVNDHMASNPYGYQSSHVSYANASVGMGYPSPYTAAPSAATYNPGPGFAFKKRFERVDWRKIAAADVDNISRGLDFNALQENVSNITFCNIESELDMRTIDPNFVKLFKLAQMTIEYLLHSQDYLSGVVMSLEEKLRTVMKEHEETKKALAKATNDLVEVKRESHKRKKLLMTQQQMIQTGANSYNKRCNSSSFPRRIPLQLVQSLYQCPQCSKAFINASFLNAHITRRHPECINQLVPAIGQGAPPTPQPANCVLERQLLDIQQRLMQTEAQLVEERNARNAQNAVVMKGKNQKIMADQDTEDDLEMWKTEQLQQHKREMERLRETFMKELTEMNEKNSASEMAVQKLQRQLARQSGLGQLEDDDVADDNKQALKKQHHEITRLKEQMQQQVAKVEGAMSEKFREQERKWQTKLDIMTQQHKEELEQAVNVSAVDMRRRRQGQGETSAGYKMKKQEHDQRPQPETTQVMRMDQEQEEEQLRPAPRREVTTVTTMTYKTNGKKDSDSVEESSDEETDNAMEQTTGDATTTFGTMTMPTLGTETLSFRETKKTRLLDQMKHDPNFLENMKQQLRNVLDKELEKCGIPSGTERLSNSVYQSKLALLKNERQKKAKRCPTLYNIRQQHINMVEQQAKQEMKKRFGSPKPSAAGTPSRGWNSAPSTPQMKSDGTPARVPPVPAPRTASPNTMMGTASTFSSTARATPQPRARKTSSSQWDSEDDDEDDDDDDDDDEDEDAVDAIAAAQGASIFSQRSVANRTGNETISDNDEWDSSEPVSPEATNRHGQPPMLQYNTNSSSSTKVVLRQPRGQNVAALAKTIDHKLNMRSTTKKPAGAVNTVPGGQGQAGSSPTKGQQSSLDNDDFDDDLESVSSVEDCGSELPSPAKRSIQPQARRSIAADTSSSTNTYGTSAWGSSRAPSTAPQHPSRQSVSKSSVCSISDLDDDR